MCSTARVLSTSILRLIFAAFAIVALYSFPARGAEDIRLEWLVIADAIRYELEVIPATSNGNSTPPLSRTVTETFAVVSLEPGSYLYRVRGVYDGGTNGPWSDHLRFVVEAKPLELVEPTNASVIDLASGRATVTLRWKKGPDGSQYKIQVLSTTGVVLEREQSSSALEWAPSQTGTFRWRVTVVNATTESWSETRSFVV